MPNLVQTLFCNLFTVILIMVLPFSSFAEETKKLKFTDSLGRNICLERLPERIIITGKAGYMIVNASFFFKSAPKKLVGYSKVFQAKNLAGFYRIVDKNFAEKKILDHNTGLEHIAAIKPDLVLMKDFEAQKFSKGLEQLGIPVAFLNLETPDAFFRDLEMLGKIFGEEEQAKRVESFFRQWQKKLTEMASVETVKKPRVLLVFYNEKGGAVSFKVSPKQWFQAELVKMAGGKPVWEDINLGSGWQQVGFDQIAAWDPDIIMVTSYFGDVEKARNLLQHNQFWKLLNAVEKNRIFAFPEDFASWDQPDSRWILGLYWATMKISPQTEKELKPGFEEFYTSFYKLYNLPDEKIAEFQIRGDLF